jgi:transmembrane sensor
MKKSNFDRLLKRYLAGQVSEQERIKIEAWLDVMKTEDTTDLELSKEDEDKLFEKITSNVDSAKEITAFPPGMEKKTPLNRWVFRIAASLLIVSLVAYAAWYITQPDGGSLQVASKNGVEKIILNDGTLVWLRPGSKLIYYEKADEGIRYSELDGEALFEVVKDASHPFVIKCDGATIRVLGTSFSVKTGKDSLELKVLTGKVNLSSETDKAGVDIERNEKVIYTGSSGIKKLTLPEAEVSEITAHTEYDMEFTNTTIDEIMEKVGKKFNVKVTMTNKQIGRCRITADFTDHSLESTLQMITEVLYVDYNKKGSTITITGSGCN